LLSGQTLTRPDLVPAISLVGGLILAVYGVVLIERRAHSIGSSE
jgi:hypothetical protein